MIVDSGAQISYIKESFTKGLEIKRFVDDFHPTFGDFNTPIYQCETNLLVSETFYQDYGILPSSMSTILNMFQIDGIIGIDLFKRYRLQFKNGIVYIPPLGI